MLRCCISGCTNRYFPGSRIQFYTIPSGSRQFQVKRRRLWIEAIQRANGNVELKDNDRICGVHFISGEASMDPDRPDYVPSVFTCAKQRHSPRKTMNRPYGCRKRLPRKAKADTLGGTSPPDSDEADSSTDVQSSEVLETNELSVQTPSPPSLRKKIRGLSEEAESETSTIQSQATSTPNKTSQSLTSVVGIQQMNKMNPVVVLKTVIASTGGYQCELCSETFISVSQFIKHKRLHEEQKASVSCQADVAETHAPKDEPSFPCNMCDRSFPTTQNLKRHKLLHVKDGRKCFKCGVLFCRRHNHILFQPQIESKTVSDEQSSEEDQNVDTSESPEKSLPESVEPQQMAKIVDSTLSPTPLTSSPVSSPNAPALSSLTMIPGLESVTPSSMPSLPSPIFTFSNNPKAIFKFTPQVPDYHSTFVQPHLPQHPKLPSSLKLFSPQYLTSALLEVQRNYKYILGKRRKVQIKNEVKVESVEPVVTCPEVKPVKVPVVVKKEKIAYDLEIEI